MHVQRDKSAAAYAEERAGLKEKLERLQKANKQRRQENAEMQDRFSAMHQRASAYDQVGLPLQPCLHAAELHSGIPLQHMGSIKQQMERQQPVMRLDISRQPLDYGAKLRAQHSRLLQTFQELQQARTELEKLQKLAADHDALIEQLAAARAELKDAEKQRSQYDAMASRAAATVETRMSSVVQERDKLQEQASKDGRDSPSSSSFVQTALSIRT